MTARFKAKALGLFLLGSLLLLHGSQARSKGVAQVQETGEESLELIADLALAKLGTDRQGNLWAWSRDSSTVEVFDPEGERAWRLDVPALRSLDVDRSWGVAATAADGSALEIIGTGGSAQTITLEHNAAHVAWIDAGTVAVSTTQAAVKIELWDVLRGRLLRSFGPAEEIVPRFGAVLLRSLILGYSQPAGILFALDSVNGTLESWTLDGEVVRKDVFPAHRKAEIEEWLADFDRQAKLDHQKFTPFYEILRLAVDPDGSAWVVKSCSADRDRASLLMVSAESSKAFEIDLPSPCCSNNFTIWNDHFVSVLPAHSESTGCTVWRKLP